VAIRRVWDEIVATVGRRSKRAAAVVREASVREVDGDTIVLLFQHAVHATMLAGAPQPLLDAVHDVLGGSWQVRCEAREATRAPAAATPAAPAGPAPAPAGGDVGDPEWPEPARPGGTAAGSTSDSTGTAADAGAGSGRRGGRPAAQRGGGPAAAPPGPPGADEVDEVSDPRTSPASGEQQALALLQQSLGAEKIGEVAP
jgi:DNA polymerase-3 subunit gamma/tau